MSKVAVVLISFSILLLHCESREHRTNFETLTEDEKRLPQNALSSMQVASGLEIELFAAEPMITNPTNISVDAQGRVWVCEAYNYDVAPDKADAEGDRIVVLEDTDHDGKADKRTVFYQGKDLFLPLGITILGDKVYVTCSPNVFVFTDQNGDLVPESKDILFNRMHKGEHSTHSLMPGPDGMIYFSLGNYTRDIADKHGNPINDRAGITLYGPENPYIGGMVLRCTPDGKNVEVLGHNFRNNYEPCVDSYGNIWQSDNDDDGNAACRINFVMYYGNYGFLDEKSRASWTTGRINLEKTIQERHWHQNDPGVVPNVLITGAGSPAGMAYYEGDLLPEVFQLVPIHAEAYHNVVRAYLPARKGAGYTVEIEDIVRSQDKWFRPIDVAIAPDGSLFIADWYDPILGGGAAADADKGRIYRVAPSVERYAVPVQDFSTIDGAIRGLKNANPETRFAAFQQLEKDGQKTYAALKDLWESENPVFRARALWLLAKLDTTQSFWKQALTDNNVDIRIAAIRAVALNKEDVVPYLSRISNDDNVAVRREIAIALRYANTQSAADLWVKLARRHDGNDRWYLEALGIASDLHADLYFETWLQTVEPDLNKKSHQDIIWRSRSEKALPLLTELIKDAGDPAIYQRYFRAFDFHTGRSKAKELASLIGLSRPDQKEVAALALQQMDANYIEMTAAMRRALEDALLQTRGSLAFVRLVEKFSLKDKLNELLIIATNAQNSEAASAATDLILKFKATHVLKNAMHQNDSTTFLLLQSMKGKANSEIIGIVTSVIEDKNMSIDVRKIGVEVLGSSWPGEEKLLSMVKAPGFEDELKPVAAGILFNVYRSRIQREAAEYLPKPSIKGRNLPTIKQLLASTGDRDNGRALFQKHCSACHKVRDMGAKFGPELTQIGAKLSKEGLYRSILYPDEGVSFGFESTLVRLQDGTESMGILASETSDEIVLNLPGGTSATFAREKIAETEKSGSSLMPALAGSMTEDELIDLVEYLAYLKR